MSTEFVQTDNAGAFAVGAFCATDVGLATGAFSRAATIGGTPGVTEQTVTIEAGDPVIGHDIALNFVSEPIPANWWRAAAFRVPIHVTTIIDILGQKLHALDICHVDSLGAVKASIGSVTGINQTMLDPGVYTAQVSGVNTSGLAASGDRFVVVVTLRNETASPINIGITPDQTILTGLGPARKKTLWKKIGPMYLPVHERR